MSLDAGAHWLIELIGLSSIDQHVHVDSINLMHAQCRRLSEGIKTHDAQEFTYGRKMKMPPERRARRPHAELLVKSKDSVDNHRMDRTG